MRNRNDRTGESPDHRQYVALEFWDLARGIASCGSRGAARIEFLREISNMIIEFSGFDAVEIWLSDSGIRYRWRTTHRPEESARFEVENTAPSPDTSPVVSADSPPLLERVCEKLLQGGLDPMSPHLTKRGSFWTNDTDKPLELTQQATDDLHLRELCIEEPCRSLLIMPLVVDDQTKGLLQLKAATTGRFSKELAELYEGVADALGTAIASRRAQARLRERVKELTCHQGIARVAQRSDCSRDETIREIAQLLPPAWQFPDIAQARIVLDGEAYSTPGFGKGAYTQSAEILVKGRQRGRVEIVYTEDRPDFAAGAFLAEERSLLDSVAREVALIIEQSEADLARAELQGQLRHADRLVTIGQLAAGVAHELNEPLSSILGFAQLIQKSQGLKPQVGRDAEQIVAAALHGREIIQKLLLFSRQTPVELVPVDLNGVVRDGLYFIASRCSKNDIDLRQELAPDLPPVIADPSQLRQVVVNLVVNAAQAMANGGILTVRTQASNGHVSLIVEDSGTGMSEEVQRQIFLPFFTTKDVGEGTGLGLSVVHGIVTSHEGSIHVESSEDQGSRFEVRLPSGEAGESPE